MKNLEQIKVSVIIPVYNTVTYLQECLESILNQSLDYMEIIIVDDGSTDGSLELAKEYEHKFLNIRLIGQNHKKTGAARNVGLKAAKGEYVYFFDSDDILDKQALKYCYNLASRIKADMVVFEADIFGNIEGRNTSEYLFHKRIKEIPSCIGGVDFVEKYYNRISLLNIPFTLYSKKFLLENNIFFLENTFYEDVAFYYKVMQFNPKLMIVDKVFYHRRYRDNSVMTSCINETSILNKINVYVKLVEDSTDNLNGLYSIIAVRGIRKILQEIIEKRVPISDENKYIIIQKIKELNYTKNNISFFLDIQYCYYTVYDLFNATIENKKVYEIVYSYLEDIKTKLQLYDENSRLGIYGWGDDCNVFLKLLERFFGQFKCEIYYIQTNTVDIGNKSNMYCINDIDDLQLDTILIGSYYYEDDMMERLHHITHEKYKIYSIKRDFKYFGDIR